MALSLCLDPPSELVQQQAGVDSNNNLSVSNSSGSNTYNNSDDTTTTPTNDHSGLSQVPPVGGAKRKPSRRANTAERRATHNAVERQRRETLNGRFLDLAALLPNLSQIRRPSKSSIVNSSIAHIQASRRHRHIASRELKLLKHEGDALRRELNEWRDRAGLPRVDEPVRGDGFAMVITGELEVIQGISVEEEDEDGEDGFGSALPMSVIPGMSHHHSQQQQQQQAQAYNAAYMDDVEEEVAMFGALYAQQQQQQQSSGGMPLPPQQQVHHQQHSMMAAQPHELEDPRMAAMLLKNSNPYATQSVPGGYPTVNSRSTSFPNGGPHNWVPSQVTGFPQGHGHLFTPPPSATHSNANNSANGSPVGGVSANGGTNNNIGSPASTSSSISSLGGSPPHSIVVPSHGHVHSHPMNVRRERSGSFEIAPGPGTGGTNSPSQSPAYELHATVGMQQDFSGVPRMGGGYHHMQVQHHHVAINGHGQLGGAMQVPGVGVGGGANAVMMMM